MDKKGKNKIYKILEGQNKSSQNLACPTFTNLPIDGISGC